MRKRKTMKNLKSLLTLSVILLLTLALAACGDITTGSGTTNPNSTSSGTTDSGVTDATSSGTTNPDTATFKVTFKDYSGVTLGTVNVKSGETATAPVTPAREGYTFKGWSESLDNVTSDKTVTAQYEIKDGNNIVDISCALGANKTVTLTYAVKGAVNFCGMEGSVNVPQGFTLDNLTQGNGATANFKDGKVYFMFASNNGQNVKAETLLFTLTFSYTDSVTTADFATTVSDMYDQNYQNVTFAVIGEQVRVK